MGFGSLAVRTIGVGILGVSLWAGGSYIIDKIKGNDAQVESGYVSPKSVSIEGKKNAAGNIETYLDYKNGNETISYPVMKGPNGPLVGTIEYWWESIGVQSRSGLVQSEWSYLDANIKHSIMSDELQTVLDGFYGTNQQVQKIQQKK
jgi:hypothetical protein